MEERRPLLPAHERALYTLESNDESSIQSTSEEISTDTRFSLTNRVTYTDDNGLLLYLDPNTPTPTVLYRFSEERNARSRCLSNIYFVILYIIIRLWIEALGRCDYRMMLVCVFLSAWLGFTLVKKKEKWERELTQRTEQFVALAGIDVVIGGEGDEEHRVKGVSEEVKQRWVRYKWEIDNIPSSSSRESEENDVDLEKQSSKSNVIFSEETCSICLGEYKKGDFCVCLPCSHVYHDDCLSNWTVNHVNCPLCNFILEDP